MNYTKDDIDNLLEKWYEAKQEISLLEKSVKSIKNILKL